MINQDKYKNQSEYGYQKPSVITKDKYWWLLECLPPCRWSAIGGWEYFHVSERLTANIVTWCVTDNLGVYLEFQDDADISSSQIFEIIQASQKEQVA